MNPFLLYHYLDQYVSGMNILQYAQLKLTQVNKHMESRLMLKKHLQYTK